MRKSERVLLVSINKNSQYVEALYQQFNWKYFSFLYFWHTLWQVDQGSNLCLPAVEAWRPKYWTTREFTMPRVSEMSPFCLPLPAFNSIHFFMLKTKQTNKFAAVHNLPCEDCRKNNPYSFDGHERTAK